MASSWNKPSAANQPTVKKGGAKAPSKVKGIVAGLVTVCTLGALCLWMFSDGDDAPKAKPDKERRIKEVTPGVARKVAVSNNVAKSEHEKIQKIKAALNDQVKEFVTKSPTNAIQWVYAPLNPDDPDNIFETQAARDIATLLAVQPGEHIPEIIPFGFMLEDSDKAAAASEGSDMSEFDGGNKRFVDELKKWQVTIKETDSKDLANTKKQLFDAQLEIIGGMDEGLSVNDSIRAAYEFRVRAAEARDSMIEMVAELTKEDKDADITEAMIAKVNQQLDAKGIMKVELEDINHFIEFHSNDEEKQEEVKHEAN